MNKVQFSLICVWCIFFLLMVTETNSQGMYIPNSEHPDHPGLCYYDDLYSSEETKTPFFLKPGQKRKHPKNCYRVDCSETLGLSVTGCGVYASYDHCRVLPGDKSRPYPHCCGEVVC